MALPVRQQMTYWSIAAAILVFVLWFLGDVLTPFVLGGAFAYLLDPIADRLERMGLSRGLSTAIITIFALLVLLILIPIVILPLVQQFGQLVEFVGSLVERAPELAASFQDWVEASFGYALDEATIRQQLVNVSEFLQSNGTQLATSLLSSAAGLVNVLVLLVLAPVVTVYLLYDWDNMVARVDDLLPRDHAPTIRQIFRDIDKTLAAFIRGQGTVCLILGVFYAVALGLLGLNFGVVIGTVAGLISFIPYVGAIVGGALAIGVAVFQFWGDWWWVLAVAAVFQVGQLVEGNILTPNLVGGSVGLHPVWLLFALSLFGALFGFIGLLVAVPVSASIGVVARFFVDQYRQGRLYRGLESSRGDEEA